MASSTILIVEDERDLVQILEYNLKREGFETITAGTGGAALATLDQEQRVDLVLLDLMLPDLSGIEVCRRIRASEGTQNLSVLMLTAKGEETDRVTGLEAGADDYLVKPFSFRELLLRMRAILRRSTPALPPELSASPTKALVGFIPICAECKKIRDQGGNWSSFERYIESRSEAQFSHGICPSCAEAIYGNEPWFKRGSNLP